MRTSTQTRSSPHFSARGFTLMEVVVVVAIMAIAAGVIVPAIGNLSRAELRKSARMLVTLVRQTFNDASLSGRTYCLKFELGTSVIKIQQTEDILAFDEGANKLVEANKAAAEMEQLMTQALTAADASAADDDKDDEGDSAAARAGGDAGALRGLMSFGALAQKSTGGGFQDTGKFALSENVRVMGMWVRGAGKQETEGEASLVFFPHGYTQDATVYLNDEEGRILSVKISALTGKAEVLEGYVEAKD